MGFRSENPRAHGAEHVTLAIYSFNHDSFGKTTNRAGAAGDNAAYNARENETRLDHSRQDGTAAGNAAYNAREEATFAVRSHVIPADPKEAEAWFREQERGERKNARMSDRFIGALPRELTPEQCIAAVESFCHEVTQDRVPWHFALHLELDKKNDPDWNPHAHIIFRDRDIENGRRFLYTSAGPKERAELAEKGIEFWTTKDFRVEWEGQMNRALERAGHEVRIDHRSLKEQGIDREPQIHIGPASQNAAKKGHEFESQDRELAGRTIPYSLLDQGSRAEHNTRIREQNALTRERSAAPEATGNCPSDPRTAEAFKTMLARFSPKTPHDFEMQRLREKHAEVRREMYRDQRRDRDVLGQAQQAQLREHKEWAKELYADARKAAFEQVKEQTADRWKAVRTIGDKEQREQAAKALKREQQQLYAKVSTLHVGHARIEKDQAWQALRQTQLEERSDLRAAHRDEYGALARQHIAERIGTSEENRADDLQRQANRIEARLSAHSGMATQQQAALKLAHSHASGRQGKGLDPARSARALIKTAHAENEKRTKIRERLNAMRQTNQLRGSQPDRFRAQAGRAMQALGHVVESDQQNQVRQAAASGRALTSDERASAPQDLKEKVAWQDKRAAQRAAFIPARRDNNQERGKDRGGGGRGR